ncbi:hypothetical protein PLICRDRAFT_165048 [Plicaturopsis crispa FD-325 SS-3]|nr:hypothetical protein PLICRDRAFT_165048 [Plicaturopsis crispa FD-325 SS-3]
MSYPDPYAFPGGEEPPPSFAPYEAEFTKSGESIVSHDPHLNRDGEALYRFLLSHAATPPVFRVHLNGTHVEYRTKRVSATGPNGNGTRTDTERETVVDFDFYINLDQHLKSGPVHWSVADSEPAYRGLMVREVEAMQDRRAASRTETKRFRAWRDERTARGLPPWVSSLEASAGQHDERNVMRSSKTVREWADDYCASPKYLKEFMYEKVVYGWDIDALGTAIRAAIQSTHYSGSITVDLQRSEHKICVRADNRLSRILSNGWLKLLSIVLLIYPFIWLFKRFHHLGGGRWEVCGGAYALKRPQPQTDDARGDVDGKGNVVSGAVATSGTREGEWFRQWEDTIKGLVLERRQSSTPLKEPEGRRPGPAALLLDGYSDA